MDNDERKVTMLSEGGVPIHEEYLPELLARHRNGAISFTSDLKAATKQADAIFIAVGTPQGKTGSADLSYVDAVLFVDDIEAAAESLEEQGAKLLKGPLDAKGDVKQVERIWYFKTP